jgi:Zn-dependent protease
MIKPAIVSPTDQVTTVGRIFSTPLVVKGQTWLPLTQLAVWPIMARLAKKRVPSRSSFHSLGVGAITTAIILASEWCHNLAHAAAAKFAGKPMDAIRISWGMPLVVYYDINDPNVTPRQHITRALGGPIFNLLILPIALLFKSRTKPQSTARDAAVAAVGANAFLPAVGLLPIPGIDGGPILKWSLVDRGRTPEEADQVVRKVDGALAPALALAGGLAVKKRRWLAGGLLFSLAGIALSIALGIFKEQD